MAMICLTGKGYSKLEKEVLDMLTSKKPAKEFVENAELIIKGEEPKKRDRIRIVATMDKTQASFIGKKGIVKDVFDFFECLNSPYYIKLDSGEEFFCHRSEICKIKK